MRITAYGDSAILIEFAQEIGEAINGEVCALMDGISLSSIQGITYYIPAYCSLTIGYNKEAISFLELQDQIRHILNSNSGHKNNSTGRELNIPVCYDLDFALDKNEVMAKTSLTWDKIITLHTSQLYRVYMLGFIPGFAYMGKLPQQLVCKRKANPQMHIPARSVAIAGLQTGVYPTVSHAGWQIIGSTPFPLIDRAYHSNFLFQSGDSVSFYSISREEYASITSELTKDNIDIYSLLNHGHDNA